MKKERIATDRCDTCGRKGPVVVFHQHDTSVLTQCRQCDPKNFEKQARRDIDAWLAGA